MPTRGHKILGFKWFAKCSARWHVFSGWIIEQLRKPQHFIPPTLAATLEKTTADNF